MGQPLRVLIVEDSDADASLILRAIRRGGFDPVHVRTEDPDAFRAALGDGGWHAVISDYNMPRFRCEAALEILHACGLDLPFLVVSGAIGEERAADLMRQGAHDFVSKDNLARLCPALQRALGDAAERQARRRADAELRDREAKLAEAHRLGRLGHWEIEIASGRALLSEHLYLLFGLEPTPDGVTAADLFACTHPDDRHLVQKVVANILTTGEPGEAEYRIVRPSDGETRWIRQIWQCGAEESDQEGPRTVFGVAQDVTDRKRQELRILHSEERFRTIFDNAVDGILIANHEGLIAALNPAAESMFGFRAADLLGRHLNVLIPERFRRSHDEMMVAFGESFHAARRMGEWRRVRAQRRDGREFPILASIAKANVAGERLFAAILRDMTETAEREEDLRLSREEAVRANQAKTRFLAAMSHELRTPLNAVIGFSEMIQAGMLGNDPLPQCIQYAGYILESGRHLLDVINDILDVAKLELGEIGLSLSNLELRDVIQSCLRMVGDQAQRKNIAIRFDLPPDLPVLFADERAVKQILFNLLANAITYTAPPGAVRIRAAASEGGGIDIAVEDDGIGIPEDQIERILRPFERIETEYDRCHDGVGLGLAIVNGLARRHGGHVRIDSVFGQGTVVTVHFPSPEHVLEEVQKPRPADADGWWTAA